MKKVHIKMYWQAGIFLINKGISPEKILVMGRSLGGPIATYLASQKNPKALLLEATFTSLPELGQHHYRLFPVSLLARIQYSTQKYLQKISCPVLIIHSKDDGLVPFQFGQKLFESAHEPKYFLEITGDHNYGFSDNEEKYVEKLEEFLELYF